MDPIDLTGGQGIQVGDGNVQLNIIGGARSRRPVVAGNVPHAPPAFQPREDLIAALRAAGPGVCVVTGMRGVGKTQLAAAYARERIAARWRLVAWVNAEDRPGLLNGLAVVADRLGIDRPGTDLETIAGEVRNHLETDGERCLIVYDNVTDPNEIGPYVPCEGDSQVVVTSTQVSALDLGEPTQVDVFSEQESSDFLTESAHLDDPDGARTLASEVGRLPLALAQAAAVIRAQHLTYPVYLDRLRSHPAQKYLPAARGGRFRYPRGVADVILMSIDAVTASDSTGLCGDLLAVISLLSADGVSRDLLHTSGPAGPFLGQAAEIDEALASLADASLLTFSGQDESEPTLTAHRLVTRVTRERHAHAGTLTGIGAKTCALLALAFRSLGEPWQRRAAARGLVRQVIALNEHLAPRIAADDIAADDNAADNIAADNIAADDIALAESLLLRRSWALWCLDSLGDSAAQGVEFGEPLVADLERVMGESHPETLTARSNLAASYVSAGRVGDAVPLLEQTLADRVRVLGEAHPDTLHSRSNLAGAYRAAGRADDAVRLLERVVADRARVLGESHPDTLSSRNSLAASYVSAGRAADAVPLLEQTLADRVRVLGEAHPDTLHSRTNLAGAYRAAGRADDAVRLLEQTLADLARVLGESHPETLTARNNLAASYVSAGRAGDAVPLHERTLADYARVLGVWHPNTLNSLNNLASTYRKVGRVAEAIPLFEASLAGFERVLGPEHPSTVTVRQNLAGAKRAAGTERG